MESPAVLPVLSVALLTAHPAGGQRGQQPDLPEGEGRGLVEATCTTCHGLAPITRSAGYDTRERWREIIGTMVEMADAQEATIAPYLAEHFPEDESRRPTLVPGDAEIELTEWMVPTLAQRPRDPIEGPDGDTWWAGMWASLVGRLDPATGTMEEYHLLADARGPGLGLDLGELSGVGIRPTQQPPGRHLRGPGRISGEVPLPRMMRPVPAIRSGRPAGRSSGGGLP